MSFPILNTIFCIMKGLILEMEKTQSSIDGRATFYFLISLHEYIVWQKITIKKNDKEAISLIRKKQGQTITRANNYIDKKKEKKRSINMTGRKSW